jgi:predicted phosphoadenosine phosphosulfate sulfurtransferase
VLYGRCSRSHKTQARANPGRQRKQIWSWRTPDGSHVNAVQSTFCFSSNRTIDEQICELAARSQRQREAQTCVLSGRVQQQSYNRRIRWFEYERRLVTPGCWYAISVTETFVFLYLQRCEVVLLVGTTSDLQEFLNSLSRWHSLHLGNHPSKSQ